MKVQKGEESGHSGVVLVMFQASVQQLLSAYLSVCVCVCAMQELAGGVCASLWKPQIQL